MNFKKEKFGTSPAKKFKNTPESFRACDFCNIREISWTKLHFSPWKFSHKHVKNPGLHPRTKIHPRVFTKFLKQFMKKADSIGKIFS